MVHSARWTRVMVPSAGNVSKALSSHSTRTWLRRPSEANAKHKNTAVRRGSRFSATSSAEDTGTAGSVAGRLTSVQSSRSASRAGPSQ